MSTSLEPTTFQLPSRKGEPTWELALRQPHQGSWTEDAYFSAQFEGLVELKDGCLEFPPMPNPLHQLIVGFIYRVLFEVVASRRLGIVLTAPCPIRLKPGTVRGPDVMFLSAERISDLKQAAQHGADLVVEVVSPGADSRKRDLVDKRTDYARGGVSEYWIVDPEEGSITVLKLAGGVYSQHGAYRRGESATSVLLDGFSLDVGAVFNAGEGIETAQ